MAPASNYNNGGWGYASRLWCYLGRHNAPSSRFSKNQLAQYYNAKRRQGKVMDKQLKMMCRDHSGEPALQLKCMGPCHRLLAKTKFSHSQRHNKLRWCQQCIKWRAQQDHDTVPNAHPNGVVSPDEMVAPATGNEFTPFGSFEMDESFPDAGQLDIVDEDDTDNEDDVPDFQSSLVRRGPIDSDDDSDDDDITGYAGYSSYKVGSHAATSSAAPLSAADTRSITSQMSTLAFDDGQASQSSTFQPYKQPASTSDSRAASTVSPTRPSARTPYLPPHLRDDGGDYHDPFSASTAPSVVTDDFGTGSGSVASSTQNARRPWVASQQFNAYGPDGQLQRREADVSSVQTRSSVTTASGPAGYSMRRRPDRGNWARPDMRKQFDQKVTFATSNDNIVDIYDSGSADEM